MKTELNRPIVAHNDSDHRGHEHVGRSPKMKGHFYGQSAFDRIDQQRHRETGWPSDARHVSGADVPAAQEAQIESSAPAHPVVAGCAAPNGITSGEQESIAPGERIPLGEIIHASW